MHINTNIKRSTVIAALTLTLFCLLIKWISYYPSLIETYYSHGIYPYISSLYRTLFGWIPFSIGDLLYFTAGCYLLYYLYKIFNVFAKKRILEIDYGKRIKRTFFFVTSTYIYFNLMWGLNYNRPGISSELQLHTIAHNEADLKKITSALVQKVNESRISLHTNSIKYKHYKIVFGEAQKAYIKAGLAFSFMEYKTSSVKRSMYGRLGNYVGFLGYYNPFTGEAQLNLTMPQFLIPYVSCHEMAHQLGYAKESEASFVAYLAATQSADKLFHYSTYLDLYTYANYELYERDSADAKNNYNQLDTLVKKDLAELRKYAEKRKNPIEPIIKLFYDHYLKANEQDKGVNSYNEVIGWLIAYQKKYGRI